MAKADSKSKALTWLHISDFQGGVSRTEELNDRLLYDIRHFMKQESLKPDLVFFTGDLSYSGKKYQYESVRFF